LNIRSFGLTGKSFISRGVGILSSFSDFIFSKVEGDFSIELGGQLQESGSVDFSLLTLFLINLELLEQIFLHLPIFLFSILLICSF